MHFDAMRVLGYKFIESKLFQYIALILIVFISYNLIIKVVSSIILTPLFFIITSILATRGLGSKIFELQVTNAVLIIFYGIFLWSYGVYSQDSELAVYYLPLLQQEASWNPVIYGGMPLFFVVAKMTEGVTGLTPESTIIYLRFVLLIMTVHSMQKFFLSVSGGALKKENSGVYFASIFLILDYSFSFLTMGDQLKQLMGMPFFLYALSAMINRKYLIFIAMTCVSIISHHLYIPLIFVSLLIYWFSKFFICRKTYFLLLIPLVIPLLAILAQKIVGDADYWGDKLNHPVDTGLLEGFILKPGVILATLYYLVFLFMFWRLSKKLNYNRKIMFVLLQIIILFSLSKVNIVGISFAEPARFYAMLSPFMAIAITVLFLYVRPSARIFILLFVIIYNILPMQFGVKAKNYYLSRIGQSLLDSLDTVFNQDERLLMFILITIAFITSLVLVSGLIKNSSRSSC